MVEHHVSTMMVSVQIRLLIIINNIFGYQKTNLNWLLALSTIVKMV